MLDQVKITTKNTTYTGQVMPNSTETTLILKLDNGYNIGITTASIIKKELLKKGSTPKKKPSSASSGNPSKPLLILIHTGGTIASKVDYSTGAVVAQLSPNELTASIPQLKDICRLRSIQAFNVQSEALRFGHYNKLATLIQQELKHNPTGIIITHGTDTMHYTSAALTFMLEHVPVPVILVGSQRSSDRGSTDAHLNLIGAAKYAVKGSPGVYLAMHENSNDKQVVILDGIHVRKMHTTRRDAFKAVNGAPIATIGTTTTIFHERSLPKQPLKLRKLKDIKVGLLKSHTNLYPEDFLHYKNHAGLIIEGTGLGHTQSEHYDPLSKLNEENKTAIGILAKNTVVVMTSQCINGRVNMHVYSPQRKLQQLGVIGGEDMMPEVAFIKLAYLLSNYPLEKAKTLMTTNLRGEISRRSIYHA